MKKIKIYADKREYLVPDILDDMCIVKKRNLHCADYILSKDIACERKTMDDFIQSIVDGRLFKQLGKMKEQFKKPLLIIEGESFDEAFEKRNVHPNAVMGAIASVATDLSIPIIWTKNMSETSQMLFLIAKREQDKKAEFKIRNKKQPKSENEEQEFLISGLPNINSILAKRLLKHFGTPANIFAADEKELQKVKGIGKKLAKRIRAILDKEYEMSVLE